jgi:microcystin-dependent protein
MAAALLLTLPAMGMGRPMDIPYQGRLLDATGNVPPANARHKTLEFRFYEELSGGKPLRYNNGWCQAEDESGGAVFTTNVFLNDNGQFSTAIPDDNVFGLLGSLLFSRAQSTLYVGVTVKGDAGEITPRQKIMTVPRAVCAAFCTVAKNDMTVGNVCTSATATVTQSLSAGSLSTGGKLECATLAAGEMTAPAVVVTEKSKGVGGVVDGKGVIPVGGIVFWSGVVDSIPNGWALCNGQTVNGVRTPNLSDRFIVGVGSGYSLGATGGEASHRLTAAEMPSHNHAYKFTGADIDQSWDSDNYFYCQHNQYPNNANTKYTEYTGGNAAHENRPPYYALCYIMRVR